MNKKPFVQIIQSEFVGSHPERVINLFDNFDSESADCVDTWIKLMRKNWDVYYSHTGNGFYGKEIRWTVREYYYTQNSENIRVFKKDNGLFARDYDPLPPNIQWRVESITWKEALERDSFKLS